MPDAGLAVGAAFDAAVVQGTLASSARLRRILERVAALACCQQAAATDRVSRHLWSELHTCSVPLMERGAAVAEWRRLTCWLVRNRAVQSRDGLDELIAVATQRGEKAARKYRQWLALPERRSGRKRLVRALARATEALISDETWPRVWDAQRVKLADTDLGNCTLAAEVNIFLQGWLEVWRGVRASEPAAAARLRLELARSQQASRLGVRLHAVLKHTDDRAAWHKAGALQTQLQGHADAYDRAARHAAVLLRLPLAPRFGVSESPTL